MSGLFDQEIPHAVSSARLLELYPRWPDDISVPFLAKYLLDRTLTDQTNSRNFPGVVHGTVERSMLWEQPEQSADYQKRRYILTQTLCHLAAVATDTNRTAKWALIDDLGRKDLADSERAHLRDIERHTLVAAAYLGMNLLIMQLLGNESISLHGHTYFGRFWTVPQEPETTRSYLATFPTRLSKRTPVIIVQYFKQHQRVI